MALATLTASAQDNPATTSWIDSISASPVGALKTEHLDGPSQWGAGLNLGYSVNPFVTIQVVNLSFEGDRKCGRDAWGGLLVDETAVQVDAKIAKFSTETFSIHLVGGAQTDWNDNNYGVNVGAKVCLDPSKHFGLFAGYDLQTWLKAKTKVDSLLSFGFKVTI
jgi:hypothetical protein